MQITVDEALSRGGTGRFQARLLAIFGLVWAADAMQVIAVGFAAPSVAASFGIERVTAFQIGTVFFLGMFFGAWIFGRLADRIGRRNLLMATVAMDAVFGLASVFAQDFTWLLVLRFLTGAAVGGTLPVDYAMMAEFLPPRNRGRWLVWLEGFWAIGTIVIALTAWIAATYGAAAPWRWIFAIAAIPALIGVFLRLWVPESPMYLVRQGRAAEAKAVVDRVLAANGMQTLPAGAELIPAPVPAGAERSIFSAILRMRTIGVMIVWFLVSVSYYGVFVWVPGQLATEGFGFVRGYGFLVILALAQIPGYALAAWGVEALGRRATLMGFLILSAAGCFLFTLASGTAMIAGALILMSFALLGTWGALYAFTPELYPTHLRGTGMGTASAMARLGGILAPSLLAVVFARGFGFAIGVFAVLLLVAAAALLLVRAETRDTAIG
ncbi:MAG: MFS transporter [Paracoccus sp. (in: a-proteobacteria)]|uniref:MFS transporter n=1 Tax=unclassified Paracoccus (in: a-proteobacteria) TaxID=2688777 RepID=UPI0017FD56BB|nr:MFS transporter [Paracoccus sp. UBA5162]MCS5602619.1 MFS transporter [Paracoccus sp. (in: a-proteobacteria)]MDB2552333.1 MFS transporter [Paracoccus sp. (in: a-proteobacteria)]HIC67568.1 MFS transporter [Paracoccus sp. (in: a-proteobacteria)]|tara:strand:- start:3530 stop:4846 length:1317 start_codon:yes stop_codon:yes gene_type:complete